MSQTHPAVGYSATLPFEVRLVQPRERFRVDSLRASAYRKAGYLHVLDAEQLGVAADPADSLVLGFWAGEHLAATLRLNVAKSESEAQRLLGVHDTIPFEWLPAVVPGRGAVCERFRGRGIMPYLITLGLQLVRARQMATSALASQAVGTPNQQTMVAAGWTSRDASPYQSPAVKVLTGTQLLHLSSSAFDSAIEEGLQNARTLAKHTRVDLPI